MGRRWLLTLVAALVVYLGLGMAFGFHDLADTLGELPWFWWLMAPGAALASHGFLFVRWQFYLSRLGYPLPWGDSLRIYSAGLGLIAAPGRSGEALRGLWLKRRHGFPLQVGVGTTLTERLADMASALVVMSWGLGGHVGHAVLVGFLALAAGGWLLTHPQLILRLEQALERMPLHPRWHGLLRLSREALLAVARVRQLMKPWPLLVGSLLACLCWLVEAMMLQGLYAALGTSITLPQATVIRTATSLGGVLSLLPAGLGTSEATAIGLAIAFGAGRPQALAATLMLRIATLALPCLLGMVSLLRQPDLKGR